MNKLYKALLVVRSMGWEQDFLGTEKIDFKKLLASSKDLKDEELFPEDLKIVEFVDKALKARLISLK